VSMSSVGSVRIGAARVLESSADRRSEAHPRLQRILCPEKFWNLHVRLTWVVYPRAADNSVDPKTR
jgi:hypothetical protein